MLKLGTFLLALFSTLTVPLFAGPRIAMATPLGDIVVELDFGGKRNPDGQGFAAFGRAVKGMDVVRAIQKLPADGQMLREQVEITSIRRAND